MMSSTAYSTWWPLPDPMKSISFPPGVASTLEELIRLQYRTQGFTLRPHQPVKSLLAGRYGSRLRGRGLNFEEIRQYRPGDDIRNMDWRVTARTGKPHTRVYTEERDRPVVSIVDQRLSMFFGSQVSMKSVTATQLGAIATWKATQDHDRAGTVLFDDTEIEVIRPHRSRKNVTRILSRMADYSQKLTERTDNENNGQILNQVLEAVISRSTHDHLYIVISDFLGVNDDSYWLAKQISRNNDLLLFMVHDPLAREMPQSGRIALTDGITRIEVDSSFTQVQKQFPGVLAGRIEQLHEELSNFGVPTLPFNNVDDVALQMRQLLGKQGGQTNLERRHG